MPMMELCVPGGWSQNRSLNLGECHQGVARDQLRCFGCWCAEDALVKEDASNSFCRGKLCKIFVRGLVHVFALTLDGFDYLGTL
eukprot:1553332-Pleurochrysis_carterae.AAC.1